MFLWARKLKKKEGIEDNYITTFNTLKSGSICQPKKTIMKIEFQTFNSRLNIFAVYQTQKSAWNNPCSVNIYLLRAKIEAVQKG